MGRHNSGVIAGLFGLFVVAAIKGLPIGGGWLAGNWIKSMFINGTWGLGVGLLLTVLPYQTTARVRSTDISVKPSAKTGPTSNYHVTHRAAGVEIAGVVMKGSVHGIRRFS